VHLFWRLVGASWVVGMALRKGKKASDQRSSMANIIMGCVGGTECLLGI
jgi:hypothetical protein